MASSLPKMQLDAIDRHILQVLQGEGKLSNVDLAQRVHLSPSACLRRVKALEDGGVIAQYVALIDPKAVGQPGTSFSSSSASSAPCSGTPRVNALRFRSCVCGM